MTWALWCSLSWQYLITRHKIIIHTWAYSTSTVTGLKTCTNKTEKSISLMLFVEPWESFKKSKRFALLVISKTKTLKGLGGMHLCFWHSIFMQKLYGGRQIFESYSTKLLTFTASAHVAKVMRSDIHNDAPEVPVESDSILFCVILFRHQYIWVPCLFGKCSSNICRTCLARRSNLMVPHYSTLG